MNSLNGDRRYTKEDYNAVPVFYCKNCLSLRIIDSGYIFNSDFCDSCGSTDIGVCNIREWEEMYEIKYGHKFLK